MFILIYLKSEKKIILLIILLQPNLFSWINNISKEKKTYLKLKQMASII